MDNAVYLVGRRDLVSGAVDGHPHLADESFLLAQDQRLLLHLACFFYRYLYCNSFSFNPTDPIRTQYRPDDLGQGPEEHRELDQGRHVLHLFAFHLSVLRGCGSLGTLANPSRLRRNLEDAKVFREQADSL
jgi:hypothetical protein